MSAGLRVAAAARALVGARFRLHGRDAAGGLDCVGVAALALRGGDWRGEVPDDYPLRGGRPETLAARLDARLARVTGEAAAGDIVLVRAGPGQFHLAVRVEDGVVHADAALRRVVERPGALPWPVIGAWRLKED